MKKTQNSMIIQPHGEIANKQVPLQEALREVHPIPRLLIGVFICAVFAFYTPLLFLTLTGYFLNTVIGETWINLACVLALALVSLGANKIGRVLLCSVILAFAFDAYWTSLVVRMYSAHDWLKYGWTNYFDVTAIFLLNGFLFRLYKKAAAL